MRGRDLPLAALLALAISSVSCIATSRDHLTYLLEITPTESGVERRVTAVRTMNDDSTQTPVTLQVEAEVANRLERVYGTRPNSEPPESLGTDTAVVYVGSGHFDTIPEDIGNWGCLRRFDSSLGQAWSYSEQIRGEDEPLTRLETNLSAADSVADIVLGWTESELKQLPGWPTLRAYLDRDLRRQLRNCALRLWSPDSDEGDPNATSALRHPLLAGLTRLSSTAIDSSGFPGSALLDNPLEIGDFFVGGDRSFLEGRAVIAEILGLHGRAEIAKSLHFLSCADSAALSLVYYLSSTYSEAPQAATDRWTRLSRPVLKDSYPVDGFVGWDSVVVQLVLPVDSIYVATNGALDSTQTKVTWSRRVPKPGSRRVVPPLTCSASWQAPAIAAQRRLFGSVRLSDADLFTYCMWFSMLDTAQQAEWNRMLKRLRPGNTKPLEQFNFSGGNPPASGGATLGTDILGKVILLAAIKSPQPGSE